MTIWIFDLPQLEFSNIIFISPLSYVPIDAHQHNMNVFHFYKSKKSLH